MKRYVIAFDRNLDRVRDTRKLLDRPAASFVDACEYLVHEDKGLRPDVVLEFPKLAVTSAVLSTEEALALRSNPRVTSVRESRRLSGPSLLAPMSEARREALAVAAALPWHVTLVRADQCWARTTGKGVKVGVIDTGIDNGLADLPIVAGRSFNAEAPDPFDIGHPHGTMCASIIGCRRTNGQMAGIAPDCDLYALCVNKDGTTWEAIAAAMEGAAEMELDVVSLSQWDTGGAAPDEPSEEIIDRASQLLTEAGCIVIGIAGNSGDSARPSVTNPGRSPSVVAVGATNSDKSRWTRSSYGPDGLPENQSVEIAAPGDRIISMGPLGHIYEASGTSYAAPQVAGACALVKELRPQLTPAEILAIVKGTAEDLGPAGRDAEFGAGMLDCYAAISSL
jgi:subtilisin